MNGFSNWLRALGSKITIGLQRFMMGRYGNDILNMWVLGAGVIACLVSMLIPITLVDLILTLFSYSCMFVAIGRTLSRNTYKRYQENRKYLTLVERLKDREHRNFECPRCRQPVRVPRGKGKIAITCPKCKEKFIKKT